MNTFYCMNFNSSVQQWRNDTLERAIESHRDMDMCNISTMCHVQNVHLFNCMIEYTSLPHVLITDDLNNRTDHFFAVQVNSF